MVSGEILLGVFKEMNIVLTGKKNKNYRGIIGIVGILILISVIYFGYILYLDLIIIKRVNVSADDYFCSLYEDNTITKLRIDSINSKNKKSLVKEYILTDRDFQVKGYIYEVKKNEYILNFVYKNNIEDIEYIKIMHSSFTLEADIDDSKDYMLLTNNFVNKDKYYSEKFSIEELRLDATYEIYKNDGTILEVGTFVISYE